MTVAEPVLTPFMLAGQQSVRKVYSEFDKNPTKSLVADTIPQTDGRSLHIRISVPYKTLEMNSYLTENTVCVYYYSHPINTAQENNGSLLTKTPSNTDVGVVELLKFAVVFSYFKWLVLCPLRKASTTYTTSLGEM
jgi:hypothetical protein